MRDIKRVLRRAAWRIGVLSAIDAFVVLLAMAILTAIGLRLVEQFGNVTADWERFAIGVAILSVLGSIAWAVVTRHSQRAVARRVDEGAGLKETLSTALCVEHRADPWSKATVESAGTRAKTVCVAQAVPMREPRFWPVPLALALTFAVVWFAVPRVDLFSAPAVTTSEEIDDGAIREVVEEVQTAKQTLEEIKKRNQLESDEPEQAQEPQDVNEARTADDAEKKRRAAIREVTGVQEQLEQKLSSGEAQMLDQLKNKLGTLKNPGGQASELSKALSKGNFKKAQAELQKMMEAAASREMTAEERQQMAEALNNLANQLENLANDQQALKDQLEQAGIDPSLASDPQALREALEQAENLTPQQQQQLQQMADAMSQCRGMCQQMGQSMSQMAQQAQSGSQGQQQSQSQQSGQSGASSMSQQLSELQSLQNQLSQAESDLAQCRSQLQQLSQAGSCKGGGSQGGMQGGRTGGWQAGDPTRPSGGGQGGAGQGQGGEGNTQYTDVTYDQQKWINNIDKNAPPIASQMVEGEHIRGEARQQFVATVRAQSSEASQAIDEGTVPREFHDVVKRYFGDLEARTRARALTGSTQSGTEPEEDAEPADNE